MAPLAKYWGPGPLRPPRIDAPDPSDSMASCYFIVLFACGMYTRLTTRQLLARAR